MQDEPSIAQEYYVEQNSSLLELQSASASSSFVDTEVTH
jgi:hypothetical protein